jgi:hypothetical protein
MAQQASSPLAFDKGRGDADMQTFSDRLGFAMGAVFAAMLILNAVSY